MRKRHQLRLIGITYNQIESGVYAVILEEVNGSRRIPIVIGYPEAQAIECYLQNVKTPRPLTHDLMKTVLETFNVRLSCIDIHKMPNGVFSADLVLEGPDGELHKIDARSSDAMALALRTGSPIYTTSDVLDECGILADGRKSGKTKATEENPSSDIFQERLNLTAHEIESFDDLEMTLSDDDTEDGYPDQVILDFLSHYSDKEIETQIAKYASEEKYELAGRLKNLLKQRKERP